MPKLCHTDDGQPYWDYTDQLINGARWKTLEEPQMTSEERLVKAAKADLEQWYEGMLTLGKHDTWRDADIQRRGGYYPKMLELEAAVKACEAAGGGVINIPKTQCSSWSPCVGTCTASPVATTPTLTDEQRRGEFKWNDDKTQIYINNINFDSNDIYVAIMDALQKLTEREAPNGLDASQRRMGLRSTRHMGPDYGNYDYD